ncbi:MAG TPA: rod shape-determining protein MreC [Rhabdochlamydiaceae bacterium]|jgi:cell shape-determining protein MreC
MRRFSYWPYLFLCLFFFSLFSLPRNAAENMRSMAICSFSPLWRGLDAIKGKVFFLFSLPLHLEKKDSGELQLQLESLQEENRLLQSKLKQVKEWLRFDVRMQEEFERLKHLNASADPAWNNFFSHRLEELSQRLQCQMQSLPAQVIFREPSSWSSAVWIDAGEKQNVKLKKKVIAKNSPVLVGSSIIGVVEYVGHSRSRIRLITDARLIPSVRVVRGREADRCLFEHFEAILFALSRRENFFSSQEQANSTLGMLVELAQRLNMQKEDLFLAKGELRGSSAPIWRSRSHVLKGIGFNYDFADKEGPARDLRTGEPYDPQGKKEPVALLRSGDLLVTTGLDGVFPPGYRVAIVSQVNPLLEGASSYEIQAVPTAGNFNEISDVIVLPPIEN